MCGILDLIIYFYFSNLKGKLKQDIDKMILKLNANFIINTLYFRLLYFLMHVSLKN